VGDGYAATADIEQASRRHAGLAAGERMPGVVARPRLLRRLTGPARVTVVSAPPGSGKTVLLRSWTDEAGMSGRAAYVAARRDEQDPRRFWITVLDALRRTIPGQVLARALAPEPEPEPDGWAIVDRLRAHLASVHDRLWLVIDDAHELAADTLRQLELLVLMAPAELRFVLATRHDLRLGLHRLRLEGELAEIRGDDLRFSVAETRELLAAAGVRLAEPAVVTLRERTEGWAAGLRLAALSLAGSPDPEGLAAGFSGSEWTVAEYLLAEVLDRQPGPVRRLLLRTSILERVNGELADLLTGDEGGERILQDLEHSNAFVTSLDASRSWFRYHRMFAELLALELRRTEPGEVSTLHRAASAWHAAHQDPAAAVRHAQAAQDWELAARLLAGHWPALYLDGQAAAARELLTAFPAGLRTADARLAAVAAAGELTYGSVATAERYLGLAERGMATAPGAPDGWPRLLPGMVRLLLARQRGDLPAEAEAARRLRAAADVPGAAQPGLGSDVNALLLTGLGTEYWTARFDEAGQLLNQGIALARALGRPFLEFTGLANLAAVEAFRARAGGAGHGRRAIELAERHGWTGEQAAGIAAAAVAGVLAWQGRTAEAESWVRRAERAVRADDQPMAGIGVCLGRALLELGRGRNAAALTAVRASMRLSGLLAAPDPIITMMRAFELQALVFRGETARAGQVLAGLGEEERDRGEIRVAAAGLWLARRAPRAAVAALAPVLADSAPLTWPAWRIQAFLVEAIARDALGERGAAGRALERALDEAEPEGVVLPFLLYPAPGLLGRHLRDHTAHAAVIMEIQSLLSGDQPAARAPEPRLAPERLSATELRVLRYLPTNLTGPEIASQLSVSRNTVKTHMRNLYVKLGTHRRTEAVARARDLGLLASSARSGAASRRPAPTR
jgi:LuxR family transcriptional regulator, maltose regulon positive regulatory protein